MLKHGVSRGKKPFVFLCALLCCLTSAKFAFAEKRYEKKITEGLKYIFISRGAHGHAVNIHVLEVDLYNFNLDVIPVLAWGQIGSVETVSSMCKRYKAYAGINASFYNKSGYEKYPIGYLMKDGKFIFKSDINRTVFGITETREVIIKNFKPYLKVRVRGGEAFLIEGVNRPRSTNSLTLYTPHYGPTTRTPSWGKEVLVENTDEGDKIVGLVYGNAKIPRNGYVLSLGGQKTKLFPLFKRGDRVALEEYIPADWSYVKTMVTGGPLLVSGGKVTVTSEKEGFFANISGTNARTGLGVTEDNKLLLVVVDGRRGRVKRKVKIGRRRWKWVSSGSSSGLSFYGMAKLFVELGAVRAMGLDSGGSSTMVVGGEIVNKPADGVERAVSNGILVIKAQ